jgi:hypothetical protein
MFRGLERGAGGRGRWMAVRRGTVATASKRHGRKGRGKGKTGWRCSLTQCGAPGALARWRKEAAHRVAEVRQRRACTARVLRGEAVAARLVGPRAWGGGYIWQLSGLGVWAQGATRAEDVPQPDLSASPSLARA